jgi:hypothetical protein
MAFTTGKKKLKKGKKRSKSVLSLKEKTFSKLQAEHRSWIRALFRAAGFRRVPGVG